MSDKSSNKTKGRSKDIKPTSEFTIPSGDSTNVECEGKFAPDKTFSKSNKVCDTEWNYELKIVFYDIKKELLIIKFANYDW